jgi:hypothetical protein
MSADSSFRGENNVIEEKAYRADYREKPIELPAFQKTIVVGDRCTARRQSDMLISKGINILFGLNGNIYSCEY